MVKPSKPFENVKYQLNSVAFLAKSLSDENRLRILLSVGDGKKSVTAIVEELGLSQPLVSHHLKELKRSLLVRVERNGPFVYYEAADSRIVEILEALNELAADLLTKRSSFWIPEGTVKMSEQEIIQILEKMSPKEAVSSLGTIVKRVFRFLNDEARLDFIKDVVGEAAEDKVSSMVHLWLAECMDEGVDPTQMCQSLVDKVARSRQLSSVVEPEVLALFESWLEELEEEVLSVLRKTGSLEPAELAQELALSRSGATFLITKLKKDGKVQAS